MKSRAFMIFFISAVVTLIAFPDPSRAVTFPITYEGNVQVTADLSYATCEGNKQMKIVLTADGLLTATISMHVDITETACQIDSDGYMSQYWGNHDKVSTFSIKMGYVTVTGSFNDEKITGTGSGSDGYLGVTYSFTLQSTANQPPKITLEPATYPEFQMNILEEKGFSVKIRKEDGVKDSLGNWKLNWSTLAFVTDGENNSLNFINTAANQGIIKASIDEKEVRFDIIPDKNRFMKEQNVFNILLNGEHKIGLQICDTDGRCGKSEYTVYFGPFVLADSVTDMRCKSSIPALGVGKLAVGNMGHESLSTGLYIALINTDNPKEYWFVRPGLLYPGIDDEEDIWGYLWNQGVVWPMIDEFNLFYAAYFPLENFMFDLRNCTIPPSIDAVEFPSGNYRFYAIVIDYISGAAKGDIKNVTTCRLP